MVGRYFLPSFSHTSAPSFNLLPLPGAREQVLQPIFQLPGAPPAEALCRSGDPERSPGRLQPRATMGGGDWICYELLSRAARRSGGVVEESDHPLQRMKPFFGGQDRSHIVGVVFKLFSHYNSPLVRGFVVDVMFWTPRVSSKSVNNH